MVVGLLIIAIPISESAGQLGRFSTVFLPEHFCDSAIQLQGAQRPRHASNSLPGPNFVCCFP
jgi:hypothetical protein